MPTGKKVYRKQYFKTDWKKADTAMNKKFNYFHFHPTLGGSVVFESMAVSVFEKKRLFNKKGKTKWKRRKRWQVGVVANREVRFVRLIHKIPLFPH